MNRDAKRTADSPIGQQHVSTVTVGEFERQLGLRGETGGKNKTSGTGETGARRREALRHIRAVCRRAERRDCPSQPRIRACSRSIMNNAGWISLPVY